jgi:hypothetical protein
MKSIFDKEIRDELITRISLLNESNKAKWGKMHLSQMLTHCTMWNEMVFERIPCKRSLLGLVFGRMALNGMVKNDGPLRRNTPSSPELVVRELALDSISSLKQKWISSMGEYELYPDKVFLHPFFGKMTKAQVGILAYKHSDHHLRQFNG